jgi:hypothetical protein
MVSDLQALRDIGADRSEAAPDALADRLERLVARRLRAAMDADALGRAGIDGDEQRGLPLAGGAGRDIGPPHLIPARHGDRAVLGARPARRSRPLTRQQAMIAHHPQHPARAGADAGVTQPRPGLPGALAVERAGGQRRADAGGLDRVGRRPHGTGAPRRGIRPPRRRPAGASG